MIGQYLSNKNESATVPKRKKFCKLNKALVLKKFLQNFSDFSSYRIFRGMHEVLNIDENKN